MDLAFATHMLCAEFVGLDLAYSLHPTIYCIYSFQNHHYSYSYSRRKLYYFLSQNNEFHPFSVFRFQNKNYHGKMMISVKYCSLFPGNSFYASKRVIILEYARNILFQNKVPYSPYCRVLRVILSVDERRRVNDVTKRYWL